jgi:hypothetical protein
MVGQQVIGDKPSCAEVTSASPIVSAFADGDPLKAANTYRSLGVSVFPVKLDGSKEPQFSGWREYAGRLPTQAELVRWFGRLRCGIGVAGGVVSGNLAVLDFETRAAFASWCALLTAEDKKHLARCPVIRTPGGGLHVWVRLFEPVRGMKLARDATGKTLVEVRGCQHYVVAPGSPPAAHPTRRPYVLAKLGWLDGQPFDPMSLDAWHNLTLHACELNEYARPAAREILGDRPSRRVGSRPGDAFNGVVGWAEVLRPHGWRVFRTSRLTTYWTRPGKESGVSASTGFCRGESGMDLLYVFSTSAAPFEAEQSYSRFAAYALLNHHGDFKAASRALGFAGYGDPLPRIGKAVLS